MSSTLRKMHEFLGPSISQPRFWGIFAAMIVLFAIIGPFGTFERLQLPERFIYWTVTMFGSWVIAMVTIAMVSALLGKKEERPFAIIMLGGALSAFPIAGYLNIVIRWFVPIPDTLGYWYQLAYAIPISLTFSMIVYFALSGTFSAAANSVDKPNPLLDRLPREKRGPVQHLAMQDHYVSVTTTRGTELVLMRMADAVAALSEEDGLQIHRSYWVSKKHVAGHKRENGQPIVIMQDGAELPVSRSFVKQTRAQGLI